MVNTDGVPNGLRWTPRSRTTPGFNTREKFCPMSAYSVVALYVFSIVEDPTAARDRLLALAEEEGICGTLIIAPEGFNGTLAADNRAALEKLAAEVADFAKVPREDERAPNTTSAADRRLELKWSTATEKPFGKLKMKLKPEIVTLRQPQVNPRAHVGTYVEPSEWNALISDPDVIVLDTRNDYEVEIGTFARAIDPKTREFREFPAWIAENRDKLKGKTLATFCTGGIRCEKATAFLQAEGFEDVRHLKGGILKYLEEVPAEESLWQGACFVFDSRVALGHGLQETGHKVCRSCQRAYQGDKCPRCE